MYSFFTTMIKSKAVVFTSPGVVEVKEVESFEPGVDDVVIDVMYSWISNGTEGSFLRGERIEGDVAFREGDPIPFPLIAGYQKVGRVTAVGENIDDIEVGEIVFAMMSQVHGMFDENSGHVSPSVCNRWHVIKLPKDADPIAYSGLVLTQVGYNCGMRPRIEAGEVAVVVGDGMVGLWTAQTLSHRGAKVILVGRHEDRLKRFPDADNHIKLNVGRSSGVEAVKEVLEDGQIQVVVDTVGDTQLFYDYLPHMKRCGHIVSAGFYGTQDQIPLQFFRNQELSIDLVSGVMLDRMEATRDFLAAGHMDTLGLITHHFPVDDAAKAWDLIRGKGECVLGVVLDW